MIETNFGPRLLIQLKPKDLVLDSKLSEKILVWLENNPSWVQYNGELFDMIFDLFPLMRHYELYDEGNDLLTDAQERLIRIFSNAFHPVLGIAPQAILHKKICNNLKKETELADAAEKLRADLERGNPIKVEEIPHGLVLHLIEKKDSNLLKKLIAKELKIDMGPMVLQNFDNFIFLMGSFESMERNALLDGSSAGVSIFHHILRLYNNRPKTWSLMVAFGVSRNCITMLFKHYDTPMLCKLLCPSKSKENVLEAALSDGRYRNPDLAVFILEKCSEPVLKTVLSFTNETTKQKILELAKSGKEGLVLAQRLISEKQEEAKAAG